jgi:hypothetical protein
MLSTLVCPTVGYGPASNLEAGIFLREAMFLGYNHKTYICKEARHGNEKADVQIFAQ